MAPNSNRRQVIRWASAAVAAGVVAACTRDKKVAAPSASPTSRIPTTPSPSRSPGRLIGAPAVEVVNGSRSSGAVALTFHGNGDLALSQQLLMTATDMGAHITVFIVGAWLAANPSFVPYVADHGHEWANHTYTHPDLGSLEAAAVFSEIIRCRDVLSRLTGSPARWFRPSALNHATPLVLAQAGKAGYPTSVSYDVDPSDYKDPGSAAVARRTLAAVRPGSIVSLHLGHRGTLDALPHILDGLRAANLKAVTLSELLG